VATFLTAEWRKLIMAQYVVEPTLLMPYLPKGLEFDLYQDKCYVSLIGFLFDRVRLKGLAVPFHTRFEEVNLRFYVKRRESDRTVKRGVVFIREFVPRAAIAFIAKQFYEEPYVAIPTRHEIVQTSDTLSAKYAWKFGDRWHTLSATADATAQAISAGSEEEFITEHYWGYTKRSDGNTSVYDVHHPRWQMYKLKRFEVSADFGMLYGESFAFLNDQSPASVLLAEGSAVSVGSGSKLHA
jgi:uncharacterized protein YqjF (DUF2071 family)